MKKHQKHVKLARPQFGDFGRKELAILGAPCGDIQVLSKEILARLEGTYKIAYVDADHAAGDEGEDIPELSAGADMVYTDKINFHRFDSLEAVQKYQFQQRFNEQDLVLINGNHFRGSQQIVMIDPRKAESLERKKDRLTDVQLVLLSKDSTEIPEWLMAQLADHPEVPILNYEEKEVLFDWIANHLAASVAPLQGLVLAGGKSMRMGQDKGEIDYHGKPQREHLYELLQTICTETYLSGRKEQIEAWQADYPTLADSFVGLGPFGAILSAFRQNPNAAWLSVACDLPLLDKESLDFLLAQRNPSKIATAFYNPDTQFPEPLITIWEPKSYPVLLHFLAQGYSCPRKVLINSEIQIVHLPDARPLTNVNSPEELEAVKKEIKP